MKKFWIVAVAVLVLAGCSLFGPSPRKIYQWFNFPLPGTVYDYTITTTWHDASVSTEVRQYEVERVEDRTDYSAVVKLTDLERLTSFYWIIDRVNNAIYESGDTTIDDGDILVLLAPVDEGDRWSHGLGDYAIEQIRSTRTTDVGTANDVVEVRFDYDGISNVEMMLRWSPDFGLLYYEEVYDAGTSFIDEYVRELTGFVPPAE